MRIIQTRKYEMLVRVRDFGAANTNEFPADSFAGKTFADLAATVSALAELAGTQIAAEGTARATADGKDAARGALRQDLDKICRTALAIAQDVPGLEQKFRLPKGRGDQRLIAAARAFEEYVTPMAPTFVQHELPADFLNTLNHNLGEFERRIREYDKWKDAHARTTGEIKAAMVKGQATAKRLDVIVRNKLQNNQPALAEWDRTFRVLRLAKPKPASSDSTTQPQAQVKVQAPAAPPPTPVPSPPPARDSASAQP